MLSDQVHSQNLPDGEPLIAASAAMRRVLEQVRVAIQQAGHVFISGELGSGRETVARAIHQGSMRNGGQFIKVDCSRNPPQYVEKLLFATGGDGSETGVERRTLERVRPESALFQCLGGTLFLQNVGDLPART